MNTVLSLSKQKKPQQALLFYCFSLLFTILISIIVAIILLMSSDTQNPMDDPMLIQRAGTFVSLFSGGFTFILTFLILQKKKSYQDKRIVLPILAGLLTAVFSSFIGLILPAYFTTKK